MNYENIGEMIAQIIENEATPIEVADKWWKHVKETVLAADLTHPETIRLIYPIAAKIVADAEKTRQKFLENQTKNANQPTVPTYRIDQIEIIPQKKRRKE